ncbi:hypothetical protein B0H34DRAFT_809786 [Crassisporium funariophilum]|nr:hypothetical protein B0H34DRAFT_809786 [Crassisporium funariophilum]
MVYVPVAYIIRIRIYNVVPLGPKHRSSLSIALLKVLCGDSDEIGLEQGLIGFDVLRIHSGSGSVLCESWRHREPAHHHTELPPSRTVVLFLRPYAHTELLGDTVIVIVIREATVYTPAPNSVPLRAAFSLSPSPQLVGGFERSASRDHEACLQAQAKRVVFYAVFLTLTELVRASQQGRRVSRASRGPSRTEVAMQPTSRDQLSAYSTLRWRITRWIWRGGVTISSKPVLNEVRLNFSSEIRTDAVTLRDSSSIRASALPTGLS